MESIIKSFWKARTFIQKLFLVIVGAAIYLAVTVACFNPEYAIKFLTVAMVIVGITEMVVFVEWIKIQFMRITG